MKILFAGTPLIAVPSLQKLNKHYNIVGVLTNPDKGSGRGQKTTSSPVKLEAEKIGLKIFQPEKLDTDFYEKVKVLNPDILIVVAYGKIFKKEFLDIFPLGGLNVHPSLLPKYRGASPISSALLSGDFKTGISIQRVAKKMDSGAILIQEEYIYQGKETTESLTEYFSKRGAELLVKVIDSIQNGNYKESLQNDDEATYCSYIKKDDGLINWNKSAEFIERQLRAFYPWPGIYTYLNGKKLNIVEAKIYKEKLFREDRLKKTGEVVGIDKNTGILIQTGKGILCVQKLQLQSKKVLAWNVFINGVKDLENTVLGGR